MGTRPFSSQRVAERGTREAEERCVEMGMDARAVGVVSCRVVLCFEVLLVAQSETLQCREVVR